MYEKIPLTAYAKVNPSLNSRLLKPDCEVSFIPMQDVSDGGDWSHRQTRKLFTINSGYTAFQEGDILFAKITPCMENGKGTHAVGLVNGVGFGSTEFHVLRAEKEASPRFIFHLCNFRELRQAAEVQMTGSAGQKRVPKDFFSKFLVTRLNRGEQQAIATVLDTMDEAIRQTETVIAKLRQVKAGMLHDLLTCGLDENGELRDPNRHPEQFKASPLGRIPKAWDALPLSTITLKIADRDHTTPHYTNSGVPMVSPTHFFGEDGIDFDNCPYISVKDHLINRKKTDIHAGDIILHRIGAGLGRVRIVKKWMPEFSILHSLAQIRIDSKLADERFVCWVFQCDIIQEQLGIGTQSIGVPDLGLDKIGRSCFPIPKNRDEQRFIAYLLDAWRDCFNNEEIIKEKLLLVKQGLMHDLLTGTIRVPQHLQPDKAAVADTKKV
ncbi:restriction endonuclease subunit S [Desulfocastanea catecholica]